MANVPEYFGSDVFNESVMKERLPKATYKALKKTIDNGDPLDIEVANIVANAMKDWAVEKGCTHYTHWFQPMTGLTAEKLDSLSHQLRTVTLSWSSQARSLLRANLTLLLSLQAD
mgnify:CR=1 FL=1